MSERTQRMSEVIRRELAALILRNNRLEGQIITIASVETSPDMKNAFVYLSMIEKQLSQEKVLAILNRFRVEWQSEIGKRITSKFTPRLHFEFDKALERGDRVMEVLLEIERKKAEEEAAHGANGEA